MVNLREKIFPPIVWYKEIKVRPSNGNKWGCEMTAFDLFSTCNKLYIIRPSIHAA